MENYVGKRLDGRYEIHEIIGVGGMSVVYKAYDNVDDRIVAVKILKEEFANDDEFVRRFKNESKAIAVLSHPNIVKVYDVSFGDRIQYIVMEYVDGITLKEYIQKQGRITWNDAVFFISQVLRALQHAHDKGIVHRDIKPQGKPADERADIYSLGVVFYEMLAGRVPFEGDSAVSVALMQVKNTAKRLTEINPDVPIGLEQICIHSMQKNPLERYQTATEMLLDLEEVSSNPSATFDYSYIATISGLAILVIAVIVLVLTLTKGVNKDTVRLTNFVGMAYDEIVSNQDYEFNFVSAFEKTDEYEAGTVIKQSPAADEKVIKGSTVTLTVAQAVEDILVPNVIGLTQERAEQVLSQRELTNIKIAKIDSDSVKEGDVIYTEPKLNSYVSKDTMITVYVSTGPTTTTIENIRVPNVVGLNKNDATEFLKKAGFSNVVFNTEDNERPKDIVIAQSQSEGNYVKENTKITLTVSTGVTTTESTEPAEYKLTLNVLLPNYIENGTPRFDNVVVYVNGTQYSSSQASRFWQRPTVKLQLMFFFQALMRDTALSLWSIRIKKPWLISAITVRTVRQIQMQIRRQDSKL